MVSILRFLPMALCFLQGKRVGAGAKATRASAPCLWNAVPDRSVLVPGSPAGHRGDRGPEPARLPSRG